MYVCMYCGHTHKEIIFKRFLKQKVAGYSIRTTWWQGDRLGGCALYLFIYLLFLAALGLRCCTRAFSSCGERGLLFVVVRGLLIAVASLVAEHGL